MEETDIQGDSMRRERTLALSTFILILGLVLSVNVSMAQDAKLARVGVILNDGPGPVFDALRDGLAQLGYVEGRNIVIEGRFAEGHLDRVPALASELVGLNVDLIVSLGAVGAQEARKASKTIPIVFVGAIDPIAIGFAATLERPGGNVTGVTSFDPQQATKQFELLRQVIPNLSPASRSYQTKISLAWTVGTRWRKPTIRRREHWGCGLNG